MKNVIIAIVSLVVIGGGAFLFLGSDSEEPSTNNEVASNPLPPIEEETSQPVASVANQNYLEYSDDLFDQNMEKKRLLFFHADWCHFCREFEDHIKEQTLPDDLVILEIDYDSSPDLKRQYDIFVQSFLVYVDADGNVIDSWHTTEAPTLNDLIARVYQ